MYNGLLFSLHWIFWIMNELLNIKTAAVWQAGIAKNITFIVTKDCQLACKYCYLLGKNTKEQMSWEMSLPLGEPHLLRHLSDDAEVNGVGILLVVDG